MSNRPRPKVLRGDEARRFRTAADSEAIATFDPVTSAQLADPAGTAQAAVANAFEQGYQDGLAAAAADIEAATEDANKRVRRALSALTEAVNQLDVRQGTALTEIEDSLASGALALAAAVLEREVLVAEDPGADAIARALQLVPGRAPAVCRLNPEDAATLNLSSIPTAGREIEVIADPAVELGGAIVESGHVTIDAQLSSALAKVAEALRVDTTKLPVTE